MCRENSGEKGKKCVERGFESRYVDLPPGQTWQPSRIPSCGAEGHVQHSHLLFTDACRPLLVEQQFPP